MSYLPSKTIAKDEGDGGTVGKGSQASPTTLTSVVLLYFFCILGFQMKILLPKISMSKKNKTKNHSSSGGGAIKF